jgi:hypothetical protein
MSGGAFNYDQYKIGYIADEIEQAIKLSGKEKTKRELDEENWRDPDWYEKYPEDKFHYKYQDEVMDALKEAVRVLRIAQIYAHRVDWYFSGDDGEESFIERLKEDLNKLENGSKQDNTED